MVVRVDGQKGYIDLSKRRVNPEDVVRCEERFNKGKAVNSIMRHVSQISGRPLQEVNEMVAWPLARNSEYRSAYDALRHALTDQEAVFGRLNADPAVVSLVMSDVRKRLTPQPVKVRADIEVQCFTYEGIEAVRAALRRGMACGTEERPISIKLIAPPLYVMLTTSLDKAVGISTLDTAIAAIKDEINKRSGKLGIKQAPRATSTQEESALATLLEQMEKENREVDGDEDEEDAGIGGSAAMSVAKQADDAAADPVGGVGVGVGVGTRGGAEDGALSD